MQSTEIYEKRVRRELSGCKSVRTPPACRRIKDIRPDNWVVDSTQASVCCRIRARWERAYLSQQTSSSTALNSTTEISEGCNPLGLKDSFPLSALLPLV